MKTFAVTKRNKVPLKSAVSSPEESARLHRRSNSSGDEPQANQNDYGSSNGSSTADVGDEVNNDYQERKEELARIIKEEESLRRKSLQELKRELGTSSHDDASPKSEKKCLEFDNHSPKMISKALRTSMSKELSVDSSHNWTTDDEETSSKIKKIKYNRRRRNTFTDEELEKLPRLVHRNMPFKQSRQEIAVVNKTVYRGLRVQRILSQVSEYLSWLGLLYTTLLH